MNSMESIFCQDKAIAAYTFEVEVKTYIKTLKELGVSFQDAIQSVALRFNFTNDVAKDQVESFWE